MARARDADSPVVHEQDAPGERQGPTRAPQRGQFSPVQTSRSCPQAQIGACVRDGFDGVRANVAVATPLVAMALDVQT